MSSRNPQQTLRQREHSELSQAWTTLLAAEKKAVTEAQRIPGGAGPSTAGEVEFLAEYHHAFSQEDGERGETDLIYMEIETGEARPKEQPIRRVLFALRQEVANQLAKMQRDGVIQPSRSPWSSPVVLVKKQDGTHQFCVEPDSFSLLRIEDLLDQL